MIRSDPTGVTPRSPSRSAMLTAAARALHREEPPPWVLDDTLAARLAGVVGTEQIERARQTMSPEELRAFSRWVCIRARVSEDVVEQAAAKGVHQYAILGAGLDSFAYRRPDLLGTVRVFEVDHPASQAWKRARLQEIGIAQPDNLVFAPVDFERETLDAGLRAAGFDPSAPAVFSWMGVTMYLTSDAIDATLRSIAAMAKSSRLVMTYNMPTAILDDLSRRVTLALQAVVSATGEPFLSFFTPEEIERTIAAKGFAEIRDFGPEEARDAYFDGRRDVLIAGAQRVLIASVA